jgi:hypothetical protein
VAERANAEKERRAAEQDRSRPPPTLRRCRPDRCPPTPAPW